MPLISFREGVHVLTGITTTADEYNKKGTLMFPSERVIGFACASLDWYRGGFGLRLLRFRNEKMPIDNFHDSACVGVSIIRGEGVVVEVLWIPILLPLPIWPAKKL